MLTATQRIRVEWAHCDPAGIIFNPNYYLWMDGATHALLHATGLDYYRRLRDDPGFRGCALVASRMDFYRPVRFGDIIRLRSRVGKFGNTSFTVVHDFFHGEAAEPVASGCETRVWGISDPQDPAKLKASRMPDDLRQALSSAVEVDTTP